MHATRVGGTVWSVRAHNLASIPVSFVLWLSGALSFNGVCFFPVLLDCKVVVTLACAHVSVYVHVRVCSPLGGPFGSSSPLTLDPRTGRRYKSSFPQITPADQARVQAALLDELGIDRVHAVVGGSMGGMQALCFAALYPSRWNRLVSLCSTGRTSPSTVAIRSVQRAIVEMDPAWNQGNYADGAGPLAGMGVARALGTTYYRSRPEFDARFDWQPRYPGSASVTLTNPIRFAVEGYLGHAARTFPLQYDANCWLLLSRCMDLMDMGRSAHTFSRPQTGMFPLFPSTHRVLACSHHGISAFGYVGVGGKVPARVVCFNSRPDLVR
jgi:homoserine acetyltransferase